MNPFELGGGCTRARTILKFAFLVAFSIVTLTCGQVSSAQSIAPDPRASAAFDLYLDGKATAAITLYGEIVDDAAKRQDIQGFHHPYYFLLTLLHWHQQTDRLRERITFGREQYDQWIRHTNQARYVLNLIDAYHISHLVLEGNYKDAEKLARAFLGRNPVLQNDETTENKEVLLSWARSLTSQGKYQEATSVLYQALAVASFESVRIGIFAASDLCRIAHGYLINNQPSIAATILGKSSPFLGRLGGTNAHVFSCALAVFELALIGENFEIARAAEKLLADHLPKIDLLPWEARIQFAADQLYFHIKMGNLDSARQRLSEFEVLLKSPMPEAIRRRGQSIAAWANFSVGDVAKAELVLQGFPDSTFETLDPIALITMAEILDHRNKADTAILVAHAAYSNVSGRFLSRLTGAKGERTNLSISEREILRRYVELAVNGFKAGLGDEALRREEELRREVLGAMQALNADRVSRLIAFSAARNIFSQFPDSRELLRGREHTALAKIASYETLVERITRRESEPQQPGMRFETAEMQRFLGYQERLSEFDKIIEERFNEYFRMSRSGLADDQEVRKLVKADEAVLLFTRVNKGYAIACITRERMTFSLSARTSEEIDIYVRNLRTNLQTEIQGRVNDDLSFPVEDSFNLYRALLEPSRKCIDAKQHLVLVLPNELLTVPFNTLLTENKTIDSKAPQFKLAPWAIRRWSFSITPSLQLFVNSRLAFFRTFERKAYLGVGDPVLTGHSNPSAAAIATPSSFFASRGLANASKIRELPSLPETKAEIEYLASRFRKGGATTLLGSQATEKGLRGLDLSIYRVISFATHALVAGEFNNGSEPALVLTPGDESNPSDDGLLTASEISLLSISADVVILSACNTAITSGAPDAKGLSELVGAFLFSGARSVLASQWPVLSFAATELVTKAFDLSEEGRPLGDALRVAMLNSMDGSGSSFESHPRVWAPFILVGNGALVLERPIASEETRNARTTPVWEGNLGDSIQGEVLAISPSRGGDLWLSGLGDPTSTRLSSYIERRAGTGEVLKRIHSKEIAWRNLASTADGGVIAGGQFFSEQKKAGAVLSRFSANGEERWSLRIDTDRYDETLALLRDETGRTVWLISQTWFDSENPDLDVVLIIYVNDAGKIDRRVETRVPKSGYAVTINAAAMVGKMIVVSGFALVVGKNTQPHRDLVTGYVNFCSGLTWATHLYGIDPDKGTILRTSFIPNFWGLRVRVTNDGRTFVAGAIVRECSNLHTTAGVIEVDSELKFSRIYFEYGEGLVGRATDVATDRDNRLVVVGTIETSLDAPPFKPSDSSKPYEYEPPPFGDLSREKDKNISAFISVANSDRSKHTELIFSDLRGRSFTSGVFADNGDVFAGGTANGSSGWIVRFPRSMAE